jgi:hypothetical protein
MIAHNLEPCVHAVVDNGGGVRRSARLVGAAGRAIRLTIWVLNKWSRLGHKAQDTRFGATIYRNHGAVGDDRKRHTCAKHILTIPSMSPRHGCRTNAYRRTQMQIFIGDIPVLCGNEHPRPPALSARVAPQFEGISSPPTSCGLELNLQFAHSSV